MIGASGAIAGVLGAYLVLFPRSRVASLVPIFFIFTIIEIPAFIYLIFWFVSQLYSGWLSFQGVRRERYCLVCAYWGIRVWIDHVVLLRKQKTIIHREIESNSRNDENYPCCTGGAGFIGSNYVHRLIQRNEHVTIFDNLSRAGAPRNVDWLKSQFGEDGFSLIVGDVRSADQIEEAAKDADVIVHLAGQVAVTTSVTDPRDDFEANALGTFNTLEAARLSGRDPIFFTHPPTKCMAAWTM